jgi:enoyl-CoA hydratase/carnithine racemase
VTAIVPDDELDARADAAARAIAAKPREAVRATKRLMNHVREASIEAMRREGVVFRERLASDEARAAMSSFFQRR